MNAVARWVAQRPWLALLGALFVEVLAFVVGQVDFVVADPLWYAQVAHTLWTDPSQIIGSTDHHPFTMRIGLTVPIAVLYALFGAGPWTANLPALLATLGVVGVVYAAGPTVRAKWLGMLFCLACAPLVHHAAVLNADLPCAALMAWSILGLSRRDGARGAWWLVAAMVAWVMAFLVKETAVWCAVVWLYAMASDARRAGLVRAARSFAPALAVGVVLGAGYLWLCLWMVGDPLARFHGIEELTYVHAWTLHGQGGGAWFRRLTWQPPLMVAKMFRLAVVPAVLAGWAVRGRAQIWWVSTLAFLLLYWFGSTSLFSYSPLPLSQRMVLPVLPGLLVLAALGSDAALSWRPASRAWRVGAAVFLLAVAATAVSVIGEALARRAPEAAAFAWVRDEVQATRDQVIVVCGEPRCVAANSVYFGFVRPNNLTMVFAGDFAQAPLAEHARVRALVNLPRSQGARRTDPRLDRTAPIVQLGLPMLAGDADVRLYDAGDGARLREALRAAL